MVIVVVVVLNDGLGPQLFLWIKEISPPIIQMLNRNMHTQTPECVYVCLYLLFFRTLGINLCEGENTS